jgi:hypothetical protein
VPRPATHLPHLLKAILSLRGGVFLVVFALIASVPNQFAMRFALCLLALAAVKLAHRAMKHGKEGIEFPEVSAEELFDKTALQGAVLFSLLFVMAPQALFLHAARGGSIDDDETTSFGAISHSRAVVDEDLEASDEDAPKPDAALAEAIQAAPPPAAHADPAGPVVKAKKVAWDQSRTWALLGGLLLLAWAPMAIVAFLASSSPLGMFLVPQGIRMIAADRRGYGVLAAFVLGALILGAIVAACASVAPFVLEAPLRALEGIAFMVAFGLGGLYIRANARTLDLPCDEADWVPNVLAAPTGTGTNPGVAPRARKPLAEAPAPQPQPVPPQPQASLLSLDAAAPRRHDEN